MAVNLRVFCAKTYITLGRIEKAPYHVSSIVYGEDIERISLFIANGTISHILQDDGRINQPKPRPETLVMAARQTGDRNMEVSPYTSTPRPLFLVNPRLASANWAENRYLVHLAGS